MRARRPPSRFPRPATSDIPKTGIGLPAEASEALDKELEFEQVEWREARTHRLSTGVLIGIMALVLFILLTTTSGEARFAFTDALAGKELGTMSVSGFPVVLVSAIACLLAAGAFFMGRSRHTLTVTAGVAAGIAIIVGFLSWAAAGRGLPFQVAGQLQGTLSVATPLV
ncbi:ABC transporter permease, partial [Staphylococcus aureus]|nr:ABC transporter permease [Staphylococcus aureus]